MNSINEIEITQDVFQHPCAVMIAGPSMSGKTTLLKSILKQNSTLINPAPTNIYYCYSINQPLFEEFAEIKPKIKFIKGIIDVDQINEKENNLIILDDLMKEAEKDPGILDLFTKDCHHKNITAFFLTQNLFQQGKNCRTISLNCHYLIILNNPRDRQQINCLARQLYPDNVNYFMEVHQDAVEHQKYGHLLIDLHQKTDRRTRLQTNIDKDRCFYIPKDC